MTEDANLGTRASFHVIAAAASLAFSVVQTSLLPACAEKLSGPAPAQARKRDQGTSHLVFPWGRAVGKLSFQSPGSSLKTVAAVGTIEVPAGAQCRLEVNYPAAENLQWLSALPSQSINYLDLHRLPVNDEGLKYVEHLSGLEQIDLNETDVSDNALVHLQHLSRLRVLDLHSTMVKGSGLAFLSTSAEELLLASNQFGDSQLKSLPPLPNLTVLDIARCQLTNDSLKQMKKLPTLRTLNLGKNAAITDEGLKDLTALKKLRNLGIDETAVTVNCLRYVKQLPALTVLTLTFHKFSQSDLAQIRAALPHCKLLDSKSHGGFPLQIFEP